MHPGIFEQPFVTIFPELHNVQFVLEMHSPHPNIILLQNKQLELFDA